MSPTPIWSEYKITMCKSNTILDYLFSKGYFPNEMNNKHFMFNSFQNYKSCDLEMSHIGILQNEKQIIYISENRFNQINQVFSNITCDMFDYAFSSQNKGRDMIILKRGICMYINTNGFNLCGINFDKLHGGEQMCRLDLFKILDDERIGWVHVVPEVEIITKVVPEVFEVVPEVFEVVPEVEIITEIVPEVIDLTSHEEVLNAALRRNTVKSIVNKFKQTYQQVREDIKHREIYNGWLN